MRLNTNAIKNSKTLRAILRFCCYIAVLLLANRLILLNTIDNTKTKYTALAFPFIIIELLVVFEFYSWVRNYLVKRIPEFLNFIILEESE